MTGWQIDPAGVAAVLDDVRGRATSVDGLAGVLTPDETEQAVWCVSWDREYSQEVSRALGGLLAGVVDDLGAVGARVVSGAAGVGAAVSAYQAGQLDMAERGRAVMATASGEELAWFVTRQNGGLR